MYYLFLIYVFLVPFQYLHEKFPKGPTGVTYSNVMMLVMIGWWVLGRLACGRPVVMRNPLNLPLLGMLVMTYAGLALAYHSVAGATFPFSPSSLAAKRFLEFFNGFLLFWLPAHMLDTRKRIHWCLIALALAAPFVFRVFYAQLISIGPLDSYDDDQRVKGPFSQLGSNELGAFFMYGSLMWGLYAFQAKRGWEKLLLLGAAALYGVGVLYSFSRATQLAFGLGLIVVACFKYRFVLVLLLLAAATSSLWLPYSVRERWDLTVDESGQVDQSTESRQSYWGLAVDLFEESPIYGHGVGSYALLNPARMDTHNTYLRTLAETGIIAFTLFMSIWVMILMMCLRLWRGGAHVFDRYYGFFLMVVTVGLMAANFFGDRFTHFVMVGHYWIMVGIAARLYANMRGVETMAEEDTYGKPLMGEGSAGGLETAEKVPWPVAPVGAAFIRPALNLARVFAGGMASVRPANKESPPSAPAWERRRRLNIVGRTPFSSQVRLVKGEEPQEESPDIPSEG